MDDYYYDEEVDLEDNDLDPGIEVDTGQETTETRRTPLFNVSASLQTSLLRAHSPLLGNLRLASNTRTISAVRHTLGSFFSWYSVPPRGLGVQHSLRLPRRGKCVNAFFLRWAQCELRRNVLRKSPNNRG